MSRPALFLAVFVAMVALGCPEVPQPTTPPSAPASEPVVWRMSKSGLGFRLSDADGQREKPRRAPETELTAIEAQKVLDRLPPLVAEASDERSFALRERSQPPPRPGKTIQEPFPPPVSAGPPPAIRPSAGPLTITRRAPEGAMKLVPSVSVSFSTPMVAVTSVDDLAKAPPPVIITPAPPGNWRWLGTQTVVFDSPTRFPMATEYTVKVPAGTRALNGQTLLRDETWSFATPPPRLERMAPRHGPTGLDPVIFAELDQAMSQDALLRSIQLLGDGKATELHLATEDEIAADPEVRRLADKAQAGRWIALKARGPLRRGTNYEVVIPAGTPSAEGPRVTDRKQEWTFHTYRALASNGLRCAHYRCPPNTPLRFHFNNDIDEGKFDRSMVKVTPELQDLKVSLAGSNIEIRGRTRGRTKYRVTVSGALTDTYGQTLGQDVSDEVEIHAAEPWLFPEEEAMSVLDPEGGPALPVFSVNRPALSVKVYSVKPEDYPRYLAWRRDWDHEQKNTTPPGKLVAAKTLKPEKAPDELTVTPVDLSPALVDGRGQALVVVEPPGPLPRERWSRQWLRAWVQVTRIGLMTFTDDDSLVAWATRLSDGYPLSGAEVALLGEQGTSGGQGAATDEGGLARLKLPRGTSVGALARVGGDLAFLPSGYAHAGFSASSRRDRVRWLVFDDRRVYKPTESIHVKGWVRRSGMGRGGDIDVVRDAGALSVGWTAHDSQGIELGKGTSEIDGSGGFDMALELPRTPNLGEARISFVLHGASGLEDTGMTHRFSIEEFRRPEFEVSARADGGPFFVGGRAHVTAAATYYAGGGLPNADVAWRVTRADAHFVPPNRSDYAFGKAESPWWVDRRSRKTVAPETWEARTDASGEHRLRVDLDAVDPPYPMSLSLQASITDVNRQTWAAETSILVHPADVYVGLKLERAFVKAGDPLPIELLVTDLDGKAVPGREVSVRAARIGWEYKRGEAVEVESDPSQCAVVSLATPVRCALEAKRSGRYRVTATVTDVHGRKSRSERHVWVMGPDDEPDRALPRDRVQIIAAREKVGVGEAAELLLVSPFAPAEGLLLIGRQGIVHTQRFHLSSATETIRFPVDRSHLPNIQARVILLGQRVREDARGVPDPSLPKRPAFASGSISIKVPPRERALTVEAKPRDPRLEPGGRTEVEVSVRDAAGAAVSGGSVAVVVVDESVLALSSYATPDPVSFFYEARDARVYEAGTHSHVHLARPEDKRLSAREEAKARNGGAEHFNGGGLGGLKFKMVGAKDMPRPAASMAPGASMGNKRSVITLAEVTTDYAPPGPPIGVRKELGALALFAPALTTDAEGRVTVPVKLPDNLTRYRVMALVAAGERQFGAGESSITARLPLMVRPSAPRFLNYGDRFDLPVVLQNQTDAPLTVDVAARATNAAFSGVAGRRVTVPANDRVEVRLPAKAVKPGKARFQIGAQSGPWADAAEIALPVWTPATTEAFATYGVVDQGAVAQPVKMPSAVEPSFGGLQITTSSTALSALTDAVLYLVRYPFECNEQLSSRVLAVAALRDVLSAFNARDLPKKEVLAESMARDIERLAARQHYSGGWDFWRADREPWPYLSVHVTHALARAKEKGYPVPPNTLNRARDYLRSIDRHVAHWYSAESRQSIVAYALYVQNRLGDPDPARAKSLIATAGGVDKLPLEAVGWIWPTLHAQGRAPEELAEIRRVVQNRATETAGAAHFATAYSDGAHVLLHSDRRADGILLEALIGAEPESGLIPKIVTGLMAHRKSGRWKSTQENAFVLVALDRYFAAYEKATPDFVAKAWLGDRFAGEQTFKGRSGDKHQIDIPMPALAEVGSGDVVLEKTGTGRLYYRVGMTYAPSDLRPPPTEQGFTVTRVYEAVDDPSEVRRDADGTWRVKAGAKVRVRLNLVAPSRRYHVALVDMLPAGLEVMNPALAVTGAIPQDPKAEPASGWWWQSTWYEHQNIRDERVEAFASLLWEGVYDYTYVARATTPGTFVVPPPKAEEMYSPETFGRGAGDRLVVE